MTNSATDPENQELNHQTVEITEDNLEPEPEEVAPHCFIGRVIICFSSTFCIFFLIFCVTLSVMGALFSGLSSIKDVDYEADPWPITDEEGYYQSYKSGNQWVNHWHRDIPSFLTIMAGFMFTEDDSNIPNEHILNETLPIHQPTWTNSTSTKATWIGHATVLAEVDGAKIITDPMFSQRCSPVQWAGPKRYRRPACSVQDLPDDLDAVVISHTHYDHLDLNSVVALNQKYAQNLHWYVPKGSKSWFENRGIDPDNVHDMVWWQAETLENGCKIIFTPANHFSRRGAFDGYHALWGSWLVIGSKGHKFWFGGDTAYSDVFKQIGKRYGPIDLSAIPIGAYHPRPTMKFVHVDPEEAIKIHQDLDSKTSFGIHWGTFKMTPEYYLEPKERILQLVQENPGLNPFLVPDLGQTVEDNKVI